jgi:flagellar operon protein (TIGR03826 family)
MAEVRNCRRCGKIYNYLGGAPICPECKKQDEEDFVKVKEYLYQNRGASINQVSTDLDISVEKIRRYLKEGRLEITSEDGNMVLECENCGKSIKSGRFCPECERELEAGFRGAASQIKGELDSQSDSGLKGMGMRYLNKNEKKF